MKFIVGSQIRVEDASLELKDWCEEELVLDNPEYHKKKNMGLWTGNIPQKIYLYQEDGLDIVLPYGCITELMRRYPQHAFVSAQKPFKGFKYGSGINLYDYQEKAVESAIRAAHGVIVMPCGAGKTQTALELISRIGGKALWLTHTQDLLNQSLNRAKSVLNCPISSYGKITGGKVEIGTGITFATVQTMSKLNLAQLRDCWDVVIVDECHRAIGSPTKVMQFYKVLSNISCKYKYGLTATPKRADGLEKSMFALLGGVVHEVSKEEVAHTTCPVAVEFWETGYKPDLDVVLAGDGTLNYASLVSDMISNQERFDYIVKMLNRAYTYSGAILVLGNRVEYLERLSKEFNGKCICLSGMGNSKAAKAERKEALRKLNDGEISCVFATYQLAKEGLDVPNLRHVWFVTPEKDETTVTQAAGRVGRKHPGKEFGYVIDFVDDFGMYRGWKKKRERYYKKLGYAVTRP